MRRQLAVFKTLQDQCETCAGERAGGGEGKTRIARGQLFPIRSVGDARFSASRVCQLHERGRRKSAEADPVSDSAS